MQAMAQVVGRVLSVHVRQLTFYVVRAGKVNWFCFHRAGIAPPLVGQAVRLTGLVKTRVRKNIDVYEVEILTPPRAGFAAAPG
jgi:Na+/H+ antiporter NhaA